MTRSCPGPPQRHGAAQISAHHQLPVVVVPKVVSSEVRITCEAQVQQNDGNTARCQPFGGRQPVRQLIVLVDAD